MTEQLPTILYVEDREDKQYMIVHILETAGFHIVLARTGQEALEKFTSTTDCVLLDVKLPDMTGFEVCHQLKLLAENRFLPVVMLSAIYIEEVHLVQGLTDGADAYLVQTVSSDVLIATLKSLLRISHLEKELVLKAQQVAILEERQRISRDLHDAVAQSLFASSLLTESLINTAATAPHLLSEQLKNINELNKSALSEMRNMLFELHLNEHSEVHLPSLFKQLVAVVHGKNKFILTSQVDDSYPMPSPLRLAFYRIAQEAFNNIYKHANATEVQLVFQTAPSEAYLIIKDNGKGFNVNDVSENTMGLGIMYQRAEAIQAQLEITSVVNQGTVVMLRWHRDTSADKRR